MKAVPPLSQICRTACATLLLTGAATTGALGAEAQTTQDPHPQADASASTEQPATPDAPDKLTGNWGGLRDRLATNGVTLNVDWVGEVFRNFAGGKNTRDTVVASTADVDLTLDTDNAFKWPGGKLYAGFEDHAGQNPSSVLTGDLQVFDRLNSSPYSQIFELYAEQKLFGETLRLKVGKVDANTEFSVIDNGADFLDSSTQVSPTVLTFPTTPDPMPGANAFFSPTKWLSISFGAYLANQRDHFLDFTGQPWTIQPTRNGAFLVGETGLTWSNAPGLGYDGNLKFGYWGHTGTFPRLDGGTQQGAEGLYAILDQTLWQPHEQDDRGLRMFLEYGRTDPNVGQIWEHVGGGLAWKGVLRDGADDEIGISPQCAFLGDQAGLKYADELIVEWFYKAKLVRGAAVQPDLQFIQHPGGQYADALVGTLQLSLRL
ncbi:MAG TPA: carbohydrate porin [Verrucomicrobiae bacterium]|nr:carbohydrate porin [Verrucomicrobiae bacterium]